MSYFVTVSFDIANATRENYQTMYRELQIIGLSHSLTSDANNTITLPSTTVAGSLNGSSAGAVRDHVCNQVQNAYTRNRLHGEVFVAVGGDWAWGHRTP